jgi:hypothetical protein
MSLAGLGRKVVPPVAGRSFGQRQPEPQRRLGAQLEQGVERENDDEVRRIAQRRVRKPESMLPARSAPKTVPGAVDRRSCRETGKPRQRDGQGKVAGWIA